MSGEILNRIYGELLLKQRTFLEQRTGYGRAITGDGATIQGTKYINFLCHEYTKGPMLCGITDCTGRLSKVGAVEATYIAHNFIGAVRSVFNIILTCLHRYIIQISYLLIYICVDRYVGAKGVMVGIGDDGADWQAALDMVIAKYPWMSKLYCASHCASKMIKAIFQIEEVCVFIYTVFNFVH